MSLAEAISTHEPDSFSAVIAMLRASGEPTRLRLLTLLTTGELNVGELCRALGQSQPRISRHLKLLADAGLIQRRQEGSFVFFQLTPWGALVGAAGEKLWRAARDEGLIASDMRRLAALRTEAARAAQDYFAAHAADWDAIRGLHVAEAQVEAAMRDALSSAPIGLLVDLGTGTGRMLELFADRAEKAIGFDVSREMLSHARSRLAAGGLGHVQVRHGDLFAVPLADGAADAVILHQVLHFLATPEQAVAEAARLLALGGRILIVDFAPHDVELLRERHEHRRLGFAKAEIGAWLAANGCALRLYKELRPEAGGKLTVSLWLAEKER
jgi:ArsR family transcriptional regulator